MTASSILADHAAPQVQRSTGRTEVRSVRKIRYTSGEWTTIAQRARACGKAPARYVRETSLGVVPKARGGQADAGVIRELGRIGTQLTRLTSMAKERGKSPEAATLDDLLAEILSVVRRLG